MKQNFIFTEDLHGKPCAINLNQVNTFEKTNKGTRVYLHGDIDDSYETVMDFEALKDHIQGKY